MKKNTSKRRRVSILTIGIIIAIIVVIAVILFIKKDDIKLNSLLKRDTVLHTQSIVNKEVEGEIITSKYINITSDGILYIFEDNGYQSGDKKRKLTLIEEREVKNINLELLKFEANNMMVVSPKDRETDNPDTRYVEMSLNGSTRIFYEKEFYELLERFGITIEGEENESF